MKVLSIGRLLMVVSILIHPYSAQLEIDEEELRELAETETDNRGLPSFWKLGRNNNPEGRRQESRSKENFWPKGRVLPKYPPHSLTNLLFRTGRLPAPIRQQPSSLRNQQGSVSRRSPFFTGSRSLVEWAKKKLKKPCCKVHASCRRRGRRSTVGGGLFSVIDALNEPVNEFKIQYKRQLTSTCCAFKVLCPTGNPDDPTGR